MHKIIIPNLFYRNSSTKEIIKSHFNKDEIGFYQELREFLEKFDPNNEISLGQKLYKCDFSPLNFKKSRRKSYRLIVACITIHDILIPIKIYKKSMLENIDKKDLVIMLNEIFKEIFNEKS